MVHIVKGEQVPEEWNHYQENRNESSRQNFTLFSDEVLIAQEVIMSCCDFLLLLMSHFKLPFLSLNLLPTSQEVVQIQMKGLWILSSWRYLSVIVLYFFWMKTSSLNSIFYPQRE